MANLKGVVLAGAIGLGLTVGLLNLGGCTSQTGACGEAAAPAPAPVPVNTCKNQNACKGHTGSGSSGNSCSTH